jgi:sec-independent protein translocase protein TatA
MLPNLGATEVIVLLAIGLLLFGKRLPDLGRSLGKALVEFKRGLRDVGSSKPLDSQSSGDKDNGSG